MGNKVKRTKRTKKVRSQKKIQRVKRIKRTQRTQRTKRTKNKRKTQKRKRVLRGGMDAAAPKEKESWSEEQIIKRNEEHLSKFYDSLSDEDLVSLLDRPCSELIISPFPNVTAEVILRAILVMDGEVHEANIPELLRLRYVSQEVIKNKIKKFLSSIEPEDRKSTELIYREFLAVTIPQDYNNEFIMDGGRTNEWYRYLFKQIIEEGNLETTHIYVNENEEAIDPRIEAGEVGARELPSQKNKYSLDDTTKLVILHKIVSRYNNSVMDRLSDKELKKKKPWYSRYTLLPPFLCELNEDSTGEERILIQLFLQPMFAPGKGETDYYLKYILLEKIVPFLEGAGTGGTTRHFDPTEIIQFAIERRLFSESAEEIYRQFTDFQVEQFDLVASQKAVAKQPTQPMATPGGASSRASGSKGGSDMAGTSPPDTTPPD